jgi:hypothetical protein
VDGWRVGHGNENLCDTETAPGERGTFRVCRPRIGSSRELTTGGSLALGVGLPGGLVGLGLLLVRGLTVLL